MSTTATVLVFGSVLVVVALPFVAVFFGEGGDESEDDTQKASECTDDTIQIPRVTADDDPYMY